jgi:hypothetical protein
MKQYFETKMTFPFNTGAEITVYCKATSEDEETWDVAIVSGEIKQPFILFQKGVTKQFMIGSKVIQPSFYVSKHQFVSNLTS